MNHRRRLLIGNRIRIASKAVDQAIKRRLCTGDLITADACYRMEEQYARERWFRAERRPFKIVDEFDKSIEVWLT